MEGLRLGRTLRQRRGTHGQVVAIMPCGEAYFRLCGNIPNAAPARLYGNGALGGVLRTGTFRRNRRYILEARRGERFEHADCDHVVHRLLLFRQQTRTHARRQQGMVVGNPPVVHGPPAEGRCHKCGGRRTPQRMVAQRADEIRNLREDIFRYITAACTGIGYEFAFIEFLHDCQRMLRRIAVLRVGVFLQRRQIVQQRGLLCRAPALDGNDRRRTRFDKGAAGGIGRGLSPSSVPRHRISRHRRRCRPLRSASAIVFRA